MKYERFYGDDILYARYDKLSWAKMGLQVVFCILMVALFITDLHTAWLLLLAAIYIPVIVKHDETRVTIKSLVAQRNAQRTAYQEDVRVDTSSVQQIQ